MVGRRKFLDVFRMEGTPVQLDLLVGEECDSEGHWDRWLGRSVEEVSAADGTAMAADVEEQLEDAVPSGQDDSAARVVDDAAVDGLYAEKPGARENGVVHLGSVAPGTRSVCGNAS